MISNTPQRQPAAAPTRRRTEPARRERLPGRLLAPILAAILAGSLLALPATHVAAQEQDTPAEDTTGVDALVEDALGTIPGFAMGVSEAPPVVVTPEGTFVLVSGFSLWIPDAPPDATDEAADDDCPQAAPIGYDPALADWHVTCIGPGVWVAEVTCGEAHVRAGRTVRFEASHEPAEQPSMYDLCGYLRCPPTTTDLPPASPDESGSPDEASSGSPAPEEITPPDSDETALSDETARPEETSDETPPAEAITWPEETPGTDEEPAGPEDFWWIPAEACGAPWPSGTWHRVSSQDPILESETLASQLSGTWLGITDRETQAVPDLSISCTVEAPSETPDETAEPIDETAPTASRGLTLTIRTGGTIAAAYGRGVPVEYRVGDATRTQEWLEFAGGQSSDAGVSVPPWLVADFVDMIRLDPEADLVIRVFGYDGAPVGTASFTLSNFESAAAPILDRCGL
ncbi:MAG: hypothetical protein F4Z22_08545 [Acidimicrobiia bacterium]|nr:hypothetical protein [Acidimicrobiia bacterium]